MSDCEVVVTESGALAMHDVATGETMHPGVGPQIEAETLYVAPSRLRSRLAEAGDALRLLDVGLGAGSNAAAAIRASAALPAAARKLTLVSFEHTLAPLALALRPEHAEAFGFDAATARAAADLLAQHRHEGARLDWTLRLGDVSVALAQEPAGSADVVFWDLYSPRSNPALWSVALFRALRRVCRDGATVHTYGAATASRTALLLAGFCVGLGPRAGRKHTPSTIAATHRELLAEPLSHTWLAQLATSRIPFPSDAPDDALARLAAHPQFRG